jgi:glycosyltransferase involved in cell wall biosynthesis
MQTYNFQNKKFNILALGADTGACGNMRIRRPFLYMNKREDINASILDPKKYDEKELKQIFTLADVIVFKAGMQKLAREVKHSFPTKPIIFDFDDDYFSILPSSEHYREYGTQEITVEAGDKKVVLWKNGANGFDIWDNKRRILDIQEMLEESDMVFAVTERLGQWLSQKAKNRSVAVVPNFLDLSLYPNVEVIDHNKGAEFRFGFCGGMSHFGDINFIKGEVIKFLKGDKNRFFYMIGQEFTGFEEVEDQVRHQPWMPFEANSIRMKVLDLDCLIAPLQDYPFNNRKDPLKFWDAAGLSLPLVASNVAPFSDVIKDKETGFLFDTPKDMIKILKKLQGDKSLGKKVGERARAVVEKRSLKDKVEDIIKLYRAVYEEKRKATVEKMKGQK